MSNAIIWEGPVYAVVCAMKATGNRPGVIAQWRTLVERWAAEPGNDDGRAAVRAWLPHWSVRPFYTAAELAPIFPALAVVLGKTKYLPTQMSARRLENELDFCKLPWVMIGDQRYFLVERIHIWQRADTADFMEFLS